MSKSLKVASLAAAIALAMGSTAAMAAAPTATQLPGKGTVVVGAATGTVTTDATAGTSQLDVVLTANSVIDWGKGTTINKDGVGGFNVGSDATVNFTGTSGVLNIDSSGNASQIMGNVTAEGNVFIANTNGIIVGKGASVTSAAEVGLIANTIAGYSSTDTYDGVAPAYNGTGGDVTVATGANVGGAAVSTLITGGNVVNVDVGGVGAAATISAGLPGGGGAFATKNAAAQLNFVGEDGGFGANYIVASAGDATNAGSLSISSMTAPVAVEGTFTNNGTLYVGGNTFAGALDNEGVVSSVGSAAISVGSLVNNGTFGTEAASFGAITTTKGGISNSGVIHSGTIDAAGDLTNAGTITAGGLTTGALSNDGTISLSGVINTTGDFLNNGSIATTFEGGTPTITVNDGSINNVGTLTGFRSLTTQSDSADDAFTAGADYSITNSGQIISSSDLTFVANDYDAAADKDNDSTGSFSNTGSLNLGGTTNSLGVTAFNDADLSGSLMTSSGTTAKAVGAKNQLASVTLTAGDTATVGAGLYTTGNIGLTGSIVDVMADAVADGNATVTAGDMVEDGYAVRLAKGMTLGGTNVVVQGSADAAPNVILQGTVEGDNISFGVNADSTMVSDVFTGPQGSVVATGTTPTVNFDFTGRIKNAPYTNSSNFRYNSLPIAVSSATSDTLALTLNPVAYTTNGTDNGLSAVNILVNGSVNLDQAVETTGDVSPGGTSVSGLSNLPNTHLVLQSTGSITVNAGYWPGYVYLGTIGSDADGNAMPGTLGFGEISLAGNFSNVLPGNVDGASGIHFMTQFPMTFGGTVITNANAWVNFATDLLTQKYTAQNDAAAFIYGGTKSDTSNVVTYGALDADSINTHPVDASK